MTTIKTIQKLFIEDLYKKNPQGSYCSPHHLSSLELIQIYQNNFFATHIDSLKASYSKTLALLGKDAFEQTARDYIRQHPPLEEFIQDYGHKFSLFIKNYQHTQAFLYLPDLVNVERCLNLAYYSANTTCLDHLTFAKEQKSDPLVNKLNLHPSCHLITSPYPLDEIITLTELDFINLEPNKTFYFLVVRIDYKPKLIKIEKESFVFLKEIYNDKGVVSAITKAIKINSQTDLGQLLLFFLKQQAFILKS